MKNNDLIINSEDISLEIEDVIYDQKREKNYTMNTLHIPNNMFELLNESEKTTKESSRISRTAFQDAWIRFKKDPLAMGGLFFVVIITLISILGPMFSQYGYNTQNIVNQNQTPSLQHFFGTDKFGRDIFIRVLYGARISLSIGFTTAFINLFIGIFYGGISGFVGGRTDMIMMRIVDIITGIPSLLYIILIMMFLGNSISSILIALCMTFWIRTAKMVRASILSLKHQEFVLAAKIIGESQFNILRKHLIPNSLGPIIVTVTFIVPSAIFSEAFLSFLGIGIQAPMASWGSLANDAIPTLFTQPYQMFFPTLAISITMFALNFIGDGLRDALDPKLKI
ncbi:MAG: ABC transporter permease [Fusobacteriaceae bacterium]